MAETLHEYQRHIYQFSVETKGEREKREEREKKRVAKRKRGERVPFLTSLRTLRRVFDSLWRGINRNLLPLQAGPLTASPSSSSSRRVSSSFPSAHLLLLRLLLSPSSTYSPSSGFLQDSALRAAPPVHFAPRGNLLFQDCESPGVFAGLPAHGTINIKVSLLPLRQAARHEQREDTDAAGRDGGSRVFASQKIDEAPLHGICRAITTPVIKQDRRFDVCTRIGIYPFLRTRKRYGMSPARKKPARWYASFRRIQSDSRHPWERSASDSQSHEDPHRIVRIMSSWL